MKVVLALVFVALFSVNANALQSCEYTNAFCNSTSVTKTFTPAGAGSAIDCDIACDSSDNFEYIAGTGYAICYCIDGPCPDALTPDGGTTTCAESVTSDASADGQSCESTSTQFASVSDMLTSASTANPDGHCNQGGKAEGYQTGYIVDFVPTSFETTTCENTCRDFCMTKSFNTIIGVYDPGTLLVNTHYSVSDGNNDCWTGKAIYVEEFCRKAYDDATDKGNYNIVDDSSYPKGCTRHADTNDYYFNSADGYSCSSDCKYHRVCGQGDYWTRSLGVDNFDWPYDAAENPDSLTSPNSYHVQCTKQVESDYQHKCFCNLNPCTDGYFSNSSNYKSFVIDTTQERCTTSLSTCQAAYNADTNPDKTFTNVSDVTKPTGCSQVSHDYIYNDLTTSNNDNLGDFDATSSLICSSSSCVDTVESSAPAEGDSAEPDTPASAPADGDYLISASGCPNGQVRSNILYNSVEVLERSQACGQLTFGPQNNE